MLHSSLCSPLYQFLPTCNASEASPTASGAAFLVARAMKRAYGRKHKLEHDREEGVRRGRSGGIWMQVSSGGPTLHNKGPSNPLVETKRIRAHLHAGWTTLRRRRPTSFAQIPK
ncbi:hypothetical protein C8R45DRAFT_931774 [Mycena sanguinolenta]|nr:hypothetical protein C8R45DRAFT_931774 [Mycena sanguinolenta]